ncbi:phosphate ABC transporter substrate-binding protein PstS [Mycobacterium simiae]|uniref:Phosphate-binding protein n=1 Tax=Mycobacterium simiae TaxID=1784 RepID=A0A5B1BLM7_MYCSI|nr:phosphate ABC transporter substrate-binding protein PstS [Mycobacterium simiae]KAA1249598.1 phosphate ABC transporter substrate-binding protein PstS [Mycobacterium simiae]
MSSNLFGGALSILATSAVLLSACGSDNNVSRDSATPGTSSANVTCGGKRMLKASGSTAQQNAMVRFAKAFERACAGQSVNYTANGSGAGITEFLTNETDFAGSDSPLSKDEHTKAEQRCGSPVWNLPMVFGPIAIAYHITGVSSLNLDGPSAAKIFNGGITMWNDPALRARNPGVTLPAEPIRVVFRSDESGTSDNFQRYLDTAADGAWGRGAGKTFNGGVGEGVQGNNGAAAAVSRTEGSISYVEWSFAQALHLNMANVVTSAGPDPVTISTDSVGRTIAAAWFVGEGNDLALDTISFYRPNQPGSYPIVLATYEVVCSKYPDSQAGTAVRAFLLSTISAGQTGLADNGYIPVPDQLRPRLSTAVNAIS